MKIEGTLAGATAAREGRNLFSALDNTEPSPPIAKDYIYMFERGTESICTTCRNMKAENLCMCNTHLDTHGKIPNESYTYG